jgi:KipI family sensor histidine kinase inhibitor
MRTRRYGSEATFVDELSPGEPAILREVLLKAVAAAGVQVHDVVPAAETLVVTHHPVDAAAIERVVAESFNALGPLSRETTSDMVRSVEISVRYDGEDLQHIAELASLSVDALIALHSGGEYVAEFCGFAPGFSYLSGLPDALHFARRSTPRTRVPAGAVAIAAGYCAVYPRESPGGWHLLGTTSLVMWDTARASPATLEPGTRVRFVRVD